MKADLLGATGSIKEERMASVPSGGWALELQGLYLLVSITVALLGAGRYGVGGTRGRWN
jgi:putative oxidoreductase